MNGNTYLPFIHLRVNIYIYTYTHMYNFWNGGIFVVTSEEQPFWWDLNNTGWAIYMMSTQWPEIGNSSNHYGREFVRPVAPLPPTCSYHLTNQRGLWGPAVWGLNKSIPKDGEAILL